MACNRESFAKQTWVVKKACMWMVDEKQTFMDQIGAYIMHEKIWYVL